MNAADLIAAGYRKVSNKYRTVARIDRPDWVQILAEDLMCSPAELAKEPAGLWADHYRRVHSKDKLTIDWEIFREIPSSCHDPVGFISTSEVET